MRSGKLVRLPLASAVRTASMSRRGGRRRADSLYGLGDGVAFRIEAGSAEPAALKASSMLSEVRAAPVDGAFDDAAPDELDDPSK